MAGFLEIIWRKRFIKRLIVVLLALWVLGVIFFASLPWMIAGDPVVSPAVVPTAHAVDDLEVRDGGSQIQMERATLKVVTLNLAHGRKDATSQFQLEASEIRQNLTDASELLCSWQPDIVASQEADGPSFWSGRFNHVAHLADGLQMRYHFQAHDVDTPALKYGTALVSNLDLRDVEALTFEPRLLTPPKGALIARVRWPGFGPAELVGIVSVHLDFRDRGTREDQLDEFADALERRPACARVVMGDFNTGWDDRQPLRAFADRLDLHTYEPDAADLVTFPGFGTRIDWILLSYDLEFEMHEILDEVVSDHRAVAAVIRKRD